MLVAALVAHCLWHSLECSDTELQGATRPHISSSSSLPALASKSSCSSPSSASSLSRSGGGALCTAAASGRAAGVVGALLASSPMFAGAPSGMAEPPGSDEDAALPAGFVGTSVAAGCAPPPGGALAFGVPVAGSHQPVRFSTAILSKSCGDNCPALRIKQARRLRSARASARAFVNAFAASFAACCACWMLMSKSMAGLSLRRPLAFGAGLPAALPRLPVVADPRGAAAA